MLGPVRAITEAMANGCPVIAANVDGIPEVVAHRQTGFCLTPTLPLERYCQFGGHIDTIPRFVYHPETDTVEAPKILDPELIAQAVEALMLDAKTYHRMSRAAISAARERFDFSSHVLSVMKALKRSRPNVGGKTGYATTAERLENHD